MIINPKTAKVKFTKTDFEVFERATDFASAIARNCGDDEDLLNAAKIGAKAALALGGQMARYNAGSTADAGADNP